jgi:isocitrate dehydrogenase (NAD+)
LLKEVVMSQEAIERAKKHFENLVKEQMARVEIMKKGQEWTDYAKLKPIIIGMIGGDGIGPAITAECPMTFLRRSRNAT